jgi:hypothetical protein
MRGSLACYVLFGFWAFFSKVHPDLSILAREHHHSFLLCVFIIATPSLPPFLSPTHLSCARRLSTEEWRRSKVLPLPPKPPSFQHLHGPITTNPTGSRLQRSKKKKRELNFDSTTANLILLHSKERERPAFRDDKVGEAIVTFLAEFSPHSKIQKKIEPHSITI